MNRLSGLFHKKKIHSLWNRPESLFLRMVQDVRFYQQLPPVGTGFTNNNRLKPIIS
ncbi:hypothetical protein [Microcoleus sp. M2_D1]|uniref:hypothetical protein n=1 Tax=Microcoleus sp. M2_D1 TaxID=3055373 RepID=UPI002FD4EE79